MRSRSRNKKIILSLMMIIIVLIVLIVLLLLGVFNKKEEIIKQKSSVETSQIIKYYKSMIGDFEDARHEYSVVDINNRQNAVKNVQVLAGLSDY